MRPADRPRAKTVVARPRKRAAATATTTLRTPLNQSLARGLQILQEFHAGSPELGVRDIARRLEMDRSNAYRLIRTLADAGFLEQNAINHQYRIGHRAFEIGQQYTRAGSLYDIAVAELRQLATANQLNTYLAERVDVALLYLTTVENESSVLRVAAGTRGHLHATAMGKVLLAFEPPSVLKPLLERLPMPRLTHATKISKTSLLAELKQIRRDGYAISDEESLYGVLVVGAPVLDAEGRVVAAISASAPKLEFTKPRLEAVIAAVKTSANAISARLDGRQGSPG